MAEGRADASLGFPGLSLWDGCAWKTRFDRLFFGAAFADAVRGDFMVLGQRREAGPEPRAACRASMARTHPLPQVLKSFRHLCSEGGGKAGDGLFFGELEHLFLAESTL